MADKLIFPIGFDLEAAVKGAGDAWDKKYAKKLEDIIAKRNISIKLTIDVKKLNTLDEVKRRLADLKIEPISRENAAVIKDLTQQLKALARAMEKVQRFKGIELPELQSAKAAKMRIEAAQATERLRLAQERVRQAEERLILSQKRAEQQARNTGRAYGEQSAALKGVMGGLAAYASLSTVSNFLNQVREVTAEFELQRVSLGAIIQDEARGNQLFAEIKSFATQSPVKLLDLTKYTKQLAAYRIETDKLFDTTKRLADIATAMGQPMDRLILAYGQIRARGFLAGGEAKQLMEFGIPITELLAEKLTKVNGELVRAADVLDMMSKRQIPFETVAEVFEDMTNKGGMFYNMQEKQGNTLYGMWQKLGDAAAIMYDQIGNTSAVNTGMKVFINTLRSLMLHWKQVGIVTGSVTVAIAANILAQRNARVAAAASTAANLKNVASLKAQEAALVRQIALNKNASLTTNITTRSTLAATRAQIQAATATNVFSKSLYGLKAALLSNPLGVLAVALTTVIGLIMTAEDKTAELQSKLTDIEADYNEQGRKLKDRFVELAEVAVGSVDGSKRQKDALDELNRTYGEILGTEALEIDSLRSLGGQYEALTEIIDAYNARKKKDAEQSEIKSNFSSQIEDAKKDLTGYLKGIGLSEDEISAFFDDYREKVAEGADATQTLIDMWNEAYNAHKSLTNSLRQTPLNLFGSQFWHSLGTGWDQMFKQGNWTQILTTYGRLLDEQNTRLDESEAKYREAANAMGVYSSSIDNLNMAFNSLDWSSMEALYNSLQDYNAKHPKLQISVPIDLTFDPSKANSNYEKLLEVANMKTSAIFSNIQDIARQEGINIPEEFYKQAQSVVEGNKGFSFVAWDEILKLPFSDKAKRAIEASRQLVEALAPSDDAAQMFNRKFMTLADNMGLSLDAMQKYLMRGGVSLEEHRKTLSDSITKLLADIARLEFTKRLRSFFGLPTDAIEDEIKKAKDEVLLIQQAIAEIPDFSSLSKKGNTADTRLQTLNKIEQSLTSINAKYDELRAKEGDTKALEHLNEIYATQFAYLNKIGKKFGLSFEMPTSFKSLQEYRAAILDVINKLKKSGLKGAETAALDLEMKIGEANVSELQKGIEAQLKKLAENVSRTKTAKEFYNKVLSQTGDIKLAAKVSTAIYGSTGEELYEDMVKYIREAFKSSTAGVEIDLSSVFDPINQRIDYEALAAIYEKYQDDIIKETRETAHNIVEEGRKTAASNILTWQKELAKAKSFEEQRTDIINRETQRRAAIIKDVKDPELRGQYLSQSYNKQGQDLSKLAIEEFKASDDYIKVFQNLDRVSSQTLDRVKKRLEEMIATAKETENVEGLKSLVEQLDKINQERESRNPIESIVASFKEYAQARRDYRTAEAEEATVKAEFAQQEAALNQAITDAKAEQGTAQQRVNDLEAEGKLNTDEGVAAQLALNDATTKVTQATEKRNEAVKKVNEAEEKTTDALDRQKAALAKLSKNVTAMANAFNSAASSIQTIAEMMGIAEDSELGDIVNGLVSGLQNAATIMTSILAIAIAIESACWWLLAIGAAVAAFSAIGSWLTGSKVRKANKEIERQQKLLDQLEYSYNRLTAAADKLFGKDYINNYNQQLKNLQATQAAYEKQAQAERSKGKKEDKARTEEYLKNARETADEIKKMQEDLTAHFTGTSRSDAAREFAKAWLDAKASFANTADAIKSKYKDLLQNMIIEGAAARIIENALSPLWDKITKAYQSSDPEKALEEALDGMDEFIDNADKGMEIFYKSMKAKGYDLDKILGEKDSSNYTGIKRDIATASEESINGLAAGINTQNYYIAQQLEEVRLIRARLYETGTTTQGATTSVSNWDVYHNAYMDQFNSLNAHAAGILAECQKAARATEAMLTQINRCVTPKGSPSISQLHVRIDG